MGIIRTVLIVAVVVIAAICACAPDGAGGLTVLAPSVAMSIYGPDSTTGLIVQGLAVRDRNAGRMAAFAQSMYSGDSALKGKTVIVTGASRGLGTGIAAHAAAAGAHLVLPVRKMSEAEGLKRKVAAQAADVSGGKGSVSAKDPVFVQLDLSSFKSIEACADALKEKGIVADALINNAGMVPINAGTTKEGFELALGINHIGTAHLTQTLAERGVLPLGRKGGLPRVVMVSSEEHRFGRLNDTGLPFGVPKNLSVAEAINPLPRYAASKLALTAYAYELSRRWQGKAEVLDMCPGPVASDIARDAPWPFNAITKTWMGVIFPPAQEAALPVLWLAADPSAAQGEVHYHMSEQRRAGADAAEPEFGQWVYDSTQEMIKLRGPPTGSR